MIKRGDVTTISKTDHDFYRTHWLKVVVNIIAEDPRPNLLDEWDKERIWRIFNFHGLRHSCATFLLRKGFNVIEVKNMLGHRSLEVTNRYVHLVANDLITTASRTGLIN